MTGQTLLRAMTPSDTENKTVLNLRGYT